MVDLASDVQIVYNRIAKCCSPIIAGAIVQSIDLVDFAKVEKVFENLGSTFAFKSKSAKIQITGRILRLIVKFYSNKSFI